MKKILKVTSIINIIYGLHYIALGIIALLGTGLGAFMSLATFSLNVIGGTIGLIFCLAICLVQAYAYGYGGICALKNNKKTALLNAVIATAIALVLLIISIISKKIQTSFFDVFNVILPVVQAFLLIQTEDLN